MQTISVMLMNKKDKKNKVRGGNKNDNYRMFEKGRYCIKPIQ